jgi:2-desacetyl-2-hydroxyethyl bacteriochlorophyllide A dehydrogenase
MRAVLLSAPRHLEVGTIADPAPGPGDVVVRVTGVGLCGTDFHIFEGHANYHTDARGRQVPLDAAPQVLGHEIAGEVVETGRDVHDIRLGDTVVVDQGRNCHSVALSIPCEYCASGDSHQCEHYGEHGITGLQGGLAEYLAMPAVNVVARRPTLHADLAALTEPLGCIVHACDVTQRVTARYTFDAADPSQRVQHTLILGAGPAGLLFLQCLRHVLRVPGRIIVSEPSGARRVLAAQLGADDVIDPADEDVVERVRDLTDGRLTECAIDASGATAVYRDLPALVRKQGTVVMYAHGQSGVDIGVLNALMFREPTLVCPVGASGGFDADRRPTTYRRALALLESGAIDVSSIVTHRYASLDDIPAAFGGPDRLAAGYIKGVYAPDC